MQRLVAFWSNFKRAPLRGHKSACKSNAHGKVFLEQLVKRLASRPVFKLTQSMISHPMRYDSHVAAAEIPPCPILLESHCWPDVGLEPSLHKLCKRRMDAVDGEVPGRGGQINVLPRGRSKSEICENIFDQKSAM